MVPSQQLRDNSSSHAHSYCNQTVTVTQMRIFWEEAQMKIIPQFTKRPTSSSYLWRGRKGQGNPFQFFCPVQTLLAIIKYEKHHLFLEICILDSWKTHAGFLYKRITMFGVFVLKWGKLTGVIPIMWSDTSCKTMHSNSKMTFPFQKFTKETEAQGKMAKVALFPFLLDFLHSLWDLLPSQ